MFEIHSFNDIVKMTANMLAEGKIVGWFQGGAEYGPRALGNRSILADPRDSEMPNKLNSRIKLREWFRPFAPAVIEEAYEEYFDLECSSPFMLFVANVRKEYRSKLPAITHVDGSARIQTVSKVANSLFYDLISQFGNLTGIPVILNTSFNIKGEPIVETPLDALECFLETGIDILILENVIVKKIYSTKN